MVAKNKILARSISSHTILPQMRLDIIFGKFETKQSFTELSLCLRYGCSRSAIRNAFIILEKEGLISSLENGTKSPGNFCKKDIDNVYDLREYIELTAVKHFFESEKKGLNHILSVVDVINNAQTSDLNDILKIDSIFHRSVIEASGNKAILQAWDNISGIINTFFSLNTQDSEEYLTWFKNSFKERHLKLFSSLFGPYEICRKEFLGHVTHAHEKSIEMFDKFLKSSAAAVKKAETNSLST